MPSGVALTTRSATPGSTSASDADSPPGASAAADAAASGRRAATITSAPASPRARTIARAAPPAPSTNARRPFRFEAFFPHRTEEAFAVGGRAEEAGSRSGDHVDRTQRRSRRREVVARRGGVGLVRHGHVEPRQREGAYRLHRRRAGARGHGERDVDPVEPGGRERGVEDGGRTGVADRVADDPGDAVSPLIDTEAPDRVITLLSRRARRCCAGVRPTWWRSR